MEKNFPKCTFDPKWPKLNALIRDKIVRGRCSLDARRQILFVGAVSLSVMHNSGILKRQYWANQPKLKNCENMKEKKFEHRSGGKKPNAAQKPSGTRMRNQARTSSRTKYCLMSMCRENFLRTGFSLIAMQATLSS